MQVQIAACIYFVTSLSISKGGISQKRKMVSINGIQKNITIQMLEERCRGFSGATLSKTVDLIVGFYSTNPRLRTF
jgi:hypothetical protein